MAKQTHPVIVLEREISLKKKLESFISLSIAFIEILRVSIIYKTFGGSHFINLKKDEYNLTFSFVKFFQN